MIRYALKCSKGHGFESWFQSADAYDGLSRSGLVECPLCGDSKVVKALMAPRVATKEKSTPSADTAQEHAEDFAGAGIPSGPQTGAPPAPVAPTLSGPVPEQPAGEQASNLSAPAREALEKLRAEVEKNSDYVGREFASEARAMQSGESPERAIHGEANAEEARALIQDGIPIIPLPFRDRRGTN